MPEAPFRALTPREASQLGQVAAGATNPTGGGAAGGLAASHFGTHHVPTPPPFLWARITGAFVDIGRKSATGCPYYTYQEVEDNHCELEHRDGVGLVGRELPNDNGALPITETLAPQWPAYEVNGCEVTTGTVVQLWRGNGSYFLFLRPACMAGESGASGFSGTTSGTSNDPIVEDPPFPRPPDEGPSVGL